MQKVILRITALVLLIIIITIGIVISKIINCHRNQKRRMCLCRYH